MTNPTTKTLGKTALVIGITGSFGGHTAQAMLKHGWRIRALARNPEAAAQKAGPRTPIEWVKGDAMNPGDVMAAAEGVEVIVHAANPPGYRNWRGLAIPMLRATIAAAKISNLPQKPASGGIPLRLNRQMDSAIAGKGSGMAS